jgi:hypothetical protein
MYFLTVPAPTDGVKDLISQPSLEISPILISLISQEVVKIYSVPYNLKTVTVHQCFTLVSVQQAEAVLNL